MTETFGDRLLTWKKSPSFVAAEIVSVLLGLIGLAISAFALFQAIDTANEGRVVNAWAVLSTATPGNSGKVAAIEALLDEGIALDGIDLSCGRMTGQSSFVDGIVPNFSLNDASASRGNEQRSLANGLCQPKTFLKDLDLTGRGFPASLHAANLSGGDLEGARLSGARMTEVSLKGAWLKDITVTETDLTKADLSFVDGWPDLTKARLGGANLDKAKIAVLQLSWQEGMPDSMTGTHVQSLTVDLDVPTSAIHEDNISPHFLAIHSSRIDSLIAPKAVLPLIGMDDAVIRGGTLEGAIGGYQFGSIDDGWANAEVTGTTLIGVSLRDADLSDVVLRQVRCINCDFSGADLTGTIFDNVEVTGSRFCNAERCATGLTTEQTSEMFTLERSDSGSLASEDMFYVQHWTSNSLQEVVQRAFVQDGVTVRSCRDTRFDDRADEMVALIDWAALRVEQMQLECKQ